MDNNKVVLSNGDVVMDITDTTAEASDVAAGEVFYAANGTRTIGTGNYMSKVANPTEDNILITDVNGQAFDSGVPITKVGGPALQTQGNWKYKVYDDGMFEAWYFQTGYNITINNQSGNLYRSPLTLLAYPTDMVGEKTVNLQYADVGCAHNNYPSFGMFASEVSNGINFYAMSGGSRGASPNYTLTAFVVGTLT